MVREVEHTSFTHIVMSATGGLAPEATTFYRRLASLLASRWGDDYSVVRWAGFIAISLSHFCGLPLRVCVVLVHL